MLSGMSDHPAEQLKEGKKQNPVADDHRLLFDGNRITDDQTAADLEMDDGDSIEVLLERKLISA